MLIIGPQTGTPNYEAPKSLQQFRKQKLRLLILKAVTVRDFWRKAEYVGGLQNWKPQLSPPIYYYSYKYKTFSNTWTQTETICSLVANYGPKDRWKFSQINSSHHARFHIQEAAFCRLARYLSRSSCVGDV